MPRLGVIAEAVRPFGSTPEGKGEGNFSCAAPMNSGRTFAIERKTRNKFPEKLGYTMHIPTGHGRMTWRTRSTGAVS